MAEASTPLGSSDRTSLLRTLSPQPLSSRASVDVALEDELESLQCHFTWGIDKSDIKRNISEELLHHLDLCHITYHGTYLNILAYLSHLEGDRRTALRFLRQAKTVLRGEKDDLTLLVTYGNYAWIAYLAGKIDKVEHYLRKLRAILKAHPKRPSKLPIICGEKGWTFLRLGFSIFQARDSFEKALKREPQNMSFNVGYAVVLYNVGMLKGKVQGEEETSKVTSQLRKALVLEPENVEVMALLALKLQSQDKNRQEAMTLIQQVLSLSPDSLLVTQHLIKFFKMEESIKESLDVLSKALEVSPTSFILHYVTGLCHQRLLFQMLEKRRQHVRTDQIGLDSMINAETAETMRHFSRAVELQPSNISARVKLAEAYGQNQQMEEAAKIFISLEKDQSLEGFERQHVLCSYGCFFMYQTRNLSAAVTQFKAAYQIPGQSGEKRRAETKLRLIAKWWSAQHSTEANEILTFLHDQDKWEQERQREMEIVEKSRVEQRAVKESRRQKKEIQKTKKKERKKEKMAMKKKNEKERKEEKQMLEDIMRDQLTV